MAAQRPRRTWGQHSRAYRDRLARQAQEQWNLSRRSIREMYNRGTYKPGARNSVDRVPQKIRREYAKRRPGGDGIIPIPDEELRDRIYNRYDDYFQNTLRWGPRAQGRFRVTLEHITRHDVLIAMLRTDMEILADYARYTSPDDAPRLVRLAGWYDVDGKWHNAFWYR